MVLREAKSPEDLGSSVWSKYGLRESPFVTTPTRLLDTLPIDKVFSGRTIEIKKMKNILNSSNTTRTLVLGDFGFGKTRRYYTFRETDSQEESWQAKNREN